MGIWRRGAVWKRLKAALGAVSLRHEVGASTAVNEAERGRTRRASALGALSRSKPIERRKRGRCRVEAGWNGGCRCGDDLARLAAIRLAVRTTVVCISLRDLSSRATHSLSTG